MTLFAFALVAFAALIHATWNLMAKRASSAGPVFVFAYNAFACVAYAPWALYLMMSGLMPWRKHVILFILLSGTIHLAYSLSLQRGYQKADFSIVYPVARGTGPLLSSVGAVSILGETPSVQVLLGILTVVIGIVLISTQGNLVAFLKLGGQNGIRWGAITGGLIASYTTTDAYAVKSLAIAPVALDWFSNLLRFFLLAPLVIADPDRARRSMKGNWFLAAGIGLLSPLSYILVLTALDMGAPLTNRVLKYVSRCHAA